MYNPVSETPWRKIQPTLRSVDLFDPPMIHQWNDPNSFALRLIGCCHPTSPANQWAVNTLASRSNWTETIEIRTASDVTQITSNTPIDLAEPAFKTIRLSVFGMHPKWSIVCPSALSHNTTKGLHLSCNNNTVWTKTSNQMKPTTRYCHLAIGSISYQGHGDTGTNTSHWVWSDTQILNLI